MALDQTVKMKKDIDGKKRIVIISDTHITPTAPIFNQKAFDKGMEIISKIKDVDLYIHLGDITNTGTLLEYEFVIDQMEKLKPISNAPIYYVIGNHDAKNVGYLLFEELIGEGRRYFEFEDPDIYILGIDSTKPDEGSGVIHYKAINGVKKRITKTERIDKLKIICFHHQLIPIPNTGRSRSAIDDSGDMLRMLFENKADLVLNGHRHISNLYNVSNPMKDLYIFNAGTFSAYKTRYRELFTYSIIDIERNSLNFRIIPIFEPQFKKEIYRTIKHYTPRELKLDEKPFCKFIQISNTLLSRESEHKKTSFDRAIEEINKIQNIDLVIHAGNLTKNSYAEEFKIAKAKFDELIHPYLVVPGFTDSKPPAWEYWIDHFKSLNPIYETEKLYFQGINSTTEDSKQGFIGRKKLQKFSKKVLNLSHEKIFGVCCFHTLIPTPLSVWKTELVDAGDSLSLFTSSQIDLVLNSSPSISFNAKIEDTIISNGGNLEGSHFDENFIEIDIYKDGLIVLNEHNLRTGAKKVIGQYHATILA